MFYYRPYPGTPIADAVTRVEGDDGMRRAAERARTLLRMENGTREVVREIELFGGTRPGASRVVPAFAQPAPLS